MLKGDDIESAEELLEHSIKIREQIEALEGHLTEIAEHIGIEGLDGERCPQTMELYKELGARGYALNSWWAMTPPEWECPACGRSKDQIARLDRHDRLMGKLVEHHDHMEDVLLGMFHDISSSRDEVVANERAEKFAKRIADVITAYDRTVVCIDCNNADTEAKKKVGTYKDFSYSPAEIGEFIQAQSRKPHSIDVARARKIWEERKEIFGVRLEFARKLAEIAAADEHWYQEVLFKNRPEAIEGKASAVTKSFGFRYFDPSILYHTESPRISLSAWRLKSHPPTKRKPTWSEINHVARVASAPHWQGVPEDWQCPGCGRTKVEIVRTSKQFKWSFVVHTRNFPGKGPYGTEKIQVCGDCYSTVGSLDKESGMRLGATVEDVRQIVRPQPHARHNYDNDVAEKVIAEIRNRVEKIELEDF